MKLPAPVQSVVLLSAIVGFEFVLQQTPLAVTSVPPSDVILPPLVAEDDVMPVTVAVVKIGADTCGGSAPSSQAIMK